MAFGSLLALLDDIASVLDDVATMSKIAVKKTTGVLGDDLALNAEQVTGVRAERELPVVWAVTKGSLKNKMILVPAALLISAFMPAAIMWLLMVGGAYLCFEGTEKILHSIFHKDAKEEEKAARQAALLQPEVDMVELEKEKIKGAIRTDFILSAEIIVISLGSIAAYTLPLQIVVLSFLALLFTFGIYGIVAGIVKMDDVGLWMLKRGKEGGIQQAFGKGLLWVAPQLMKVLSFVGTLAMFIVGGGIIVHGIPYLSHINHEIELWVANLTHVHLLGTVGSLGAQVVLGFTVGALLVGVMSAWQAVNRNKEAH